jgi:hypothetical protein
MFLRERFGIGGEHRHRHRRSEEQKRRGGDVVDKGTVGVKQKGPGVLAYFSQVPEALVLGLGCTGLFLRSLDRTAEFLNLVEPLLLDFAHLAPQWPFFAVVVVYLDAATHVTLVHL